VIRNRVGDMMIFSLRFLFRHVCSRDGQQSAHDKVRASSSSRDRILPGVPTRGVDTEGRQCSSGEVVEKLQVQEVERRKRVNV